MDVREPPAKRRGLEIQQAGKLFRRKGGVFVDIAPGFGHIGGIGLKGGEPVQTHVRVDERLLRERFAACKQLPMRGDRAHAVKHKGGSAFAVPAAA